MLVKKRRSARTYGIDCDYGHTEVICVWPDFHKNYIHFKYKSQVIKSVLKKQELILLCTMLKIYLTMQVGVALTADNNDKSLFDCACALLLYVLKLKNQ